MSGKGSCAPGLGSNWARIFLSWRKMCIMEYVILGFLHCCFRLLQLCVDAVRSSVGSKRGRREKHRLSDKERGDPRQSQMYVPLTGLASPIHLMTFLEAPAIPRCQCPGPLDPCLALYWLWPDRVQQRTGRPVRTGPTECPTEFCDPWRGAFKYKPLW